jgi:hypothetical protein
MKVICVNNIIPVDNEDISIPLTIGKEYDICFVTYCRPIHYTIVDDAGNKHLYQKDFFITLEEYRNKRLKEIGI